MFVFFAFIFCNITSLFESWKAKTEVKILGAHINFNFSSRLVEFTINC